MAGFSIEWDGLDELGDLVIVGVGGYQFGSSGNVVRCRNRGAIQRWQASGHSDGHHHCKHDHNDGLECADHVSWMGGGGRDRKSVEVSMESVFRTYHQVNKAIFSLFFSFSLSCILYCLAVIKCSYTIDANEDNG